jgi:hypothetical protein
MVLTQRAHCQAEVAWHSFKKTSIYCIFSSFNHFSVKIPKLCCPMSGKTVMRRSCCLPRCAFFPVGARATRRSGELLPHLHPHHRKEDGRAAERQAGAWMLWMSLTWNRRKRGNGFKREKNTTSGADSYLPLYFTGSIQANLPWQFKAVFSSLYMRFKGPDSREFVKDTLSTMQFVG